MSAHLPRPESRPRPTARVHAARLRRLAAAVAALIAGLLASAAIIPAASAMIIVPDPGGEAGTVRLAPVPATPVHVIAGGMAGWQITLIAVGTALITAALAVLLDRALAARRATSATST
jgi:hypothetical protein